MVLLHQAAPMFRNATLPQPLSDPSISKKPTEPRFSVESLRFNQPIPLEDFALVAARTLQGAFLWRIGSRKAKSKKLSVYQRESFCQMGVTRHPPGHSVTCGYEEFSGENPTKTNSVSSCFGDVGSVVATGPKSDSSRGRNTHCQSPNYPVRQDELATAFIYQHHGKNCHPT